MLLNLDCRYQLVPYGNYSYVKVLSEDKDLPLYGSGGFRLIWDTKFDAGMAAFLDCLQQFKEEVGSSLLQIYNTILLPGGERGQWVLPAL